MGNTCAGCGAAIDPSVASYSEKGELVCKACEAKEVIHTGDERAVDAIFGAAIGSLVLGITSLGCNPGFLMTIAAIGSGTSAMFAMWKHPEYRRTLGATRWTVSWICAAIGTMFGMVVPGLFVLGLLAAMLH